MSRIGRAPAMRLLAAIFLFAIPAPAQEIELLSQTSDGFLELDGESALEVVGFRGELNLHLGKTGELRYAAVEIGDRSIGRPVALWAEGTTLRFLPVEGDAEKPIRLDISLPPGMRSRLELSHAAVDLAGLHEQVVVRGSRLDIIGRSLAAQVKLDLTESKVSMQSIAEDLYLEGDTIDGYFELVSGNVELAVDGGKLEFNRVNGELSGEVENVLLVMDYVQRQIRVDASGKNVSIGGCLAGAELQLTEAALDLQETKGSIVIQTDAEVAFREHDGALKVVSRGGDVRGTAVRGGALHIETSDGAIQLDGIESDTMLSGEALHVEVKNHKGGLTVNSRSSEIRVEQASKDVTVQNDHGDVEVTGADTKVRVFNTNGEVRLDGLKGAVEVKAQGPVVDVAWIGLQGLETSTVENLGGDVTIRIPGNVRVRIDGEAPRGRIDSDLEDVVISDDGRYASGLLRGGQGAAPQLKVPTIRAMSAGDLYLQSNGVASGN